MAEETRESVLSALTWTPVIGEQLVCEREEGNPRDQYAVAVYKVVT